ncbi:hypothetical protein [Sphingomonas sp.]|uniref:hypothetical protein n=1 Tax=Sphingomonas sp. TaxID=28214 RepID=UPI00325FC6EE
MTGHVNARRTALIVLLASAALLGGCSRKGQIADGGVYVTRSACPLVGIVAGTGDVTLFDPVGSTDARAIDVVATMTNVRASCTDDGTTVTSVASFDVVATRRDPTAARQVVLPYFDTVMQGGSDVVAKNISGVALDFAAGSMRAQTRGQSTVRVSKAAATLPAAITRELTRQRKAGEVEAAIDPMSKPEIRAAVAKATFEQLLGFQLTEAQLRYNATR